LPLYLAELRKLLSQDEFAGLIEDLQNTPDIPVNSKILSPKKIDIDSIYKNCSQAVIDRDKKLILLKEMMIDENLHLQKNLSKENEVQDFKSLICPLCFNFIYKC